MKYIKYIALAGLVGLTSSCIDDLLNRPATTEVSSDLFWTSTDDALSSTYGVYNAVRTLFATDYYYDGHGESKILAVRVTVIFLHGAPNAGQRIFQYVEQCIPGYQPCQLHHSVCRANDSSRTECRNQSIYGGYQCRELLPACIGLFPFGSKLG